VKKFGKKTLSLALAFVMVLSLCTFVSFAAGDVVLKIGEEQTLEVNPGLTDVTWSSSDGTVVSVDKTGDKTSKIKGLKEGSATITASAPAIEADPEHNIEAQEAFEQKWEVTVSFDTNVPVTAFKVEPSNVEVPYGTSADKAAALVKKSVTVTATYGEQGDKPVTVDNWNPTAGKLYSSDLTVGETAEYTASITGLKKADGVEDPTVTVTVI